MKPMNESERQSVFDGGDEWIQNTNIRACEMDPESDFCEIGEKMCKQMIKIKHNIIEIDA